MNAATINRLSNSLVPAIAAEQKFAVIRGALADVGGEIDFDNHRRAAEALFIASDAIRAAEMSMRVYFAATIAAHQALTPDEIPPAMV
jgi:hypothetical protein